MFAVLLTANVPKGPAWNPGVPMKKKESPLKICFLSVKDSFNLMPQFKSTLRKQTANCHSLSMFSDDLLIEPDMLKLALVVNPGNDTALTLGDKSRSPATVNQPEVVL